MGLVMNMGSIKSQLDANPDRQSVYYACNNLTAEFIKKHPLLGNVPESLFQKTDVVVYRGGGALQAIQDAGQGVVTISEMEKLAVRDEWIEEKSKIPGNFIRCIEEKRNEYIAYESVDDYFAEKGKKCEKNQN